MAQRRLMTERHVGIGFFALVTGLASLPSPCGGQGYLSDAGFQSLADACRAAGKQTMLLTRAWDAVPDGAHLGCSIRATAGGRIQPAPGATVTLSGSFEGDLSQHFDLTGVASISGDAFHGATMYPQWFGAKSDGATLTGCSMAAGSRTVGCPSAAFVAGDKGKYVSVSGAGEGGSGLGGIISSVTDRTHAVLSTTASTGVSGIGTVTYGTNDYPAIIALAATASASNSRAVSFPPGMYVIGEHKSFSSASDGCINWARDIQWNNLNGTTISGYGATIYIDGSFYQRADCANIPRGAAVPVPGKSAEDTITPFSVHDATGVTIEGFSILGNKDLIVRDGDVNSESLTSFCVTVGGTRPSTNYTMRDMTCTQPQTDCFIFGYNNTVTDRNATGSNLTCLEPARGSFSAGNVDGLHLSGVHGSNAGAGSYGGYQPFHCVSIEPDELHTTDNIVMDGNSTCTNDIGWEFSISDAAVVGHVTVKDSVFSWNNANKQQGFNVFSQFSEISNNVFNVGYSGSASNVEAGSRYYPWKAMTKYSAGNIVMDPAGHEQECTVGGVSGASTPQWDDSGRTTVDGSVTWRNRGTGMVSQVWRGNRFVDTTGRAGLPIFSTGTQPDGTQNPIDLIDNMFRLSGLVVNARNVRRAAGNHFYWMANGSEAGTITAVNWEGSRNVADDAYESNLPGNNPAKPGAVLEIYYKGSGSEPLNERYASPVFRTNLTDAAH